MALKIKPEIWDAMGSPFWAKHTNDSMFINDLSKSCQYNILEINDNMFMSRLSLDNRYYNV